MSAAAIQSKLLETFVEDAILQRRLTNYPGHLRLGCGRAGKCDVPPDTGVGHCFPILHAVLFEVRGWPPHCAQRRFFFRREGPTVNGGSGGLLIDQLVFSQGQQAIPFLFDWRQLHHFIYVFAASGQLFQRVVPGLRVDQLL